MEVAHEETTEKKQVRTQRKQKKGNVARAGGAAIGGASRSSVPKRPAGSRARPAAAGPAADGSGGAPACRARPAKCPSTAACTKPRLEHSPMVDNRKMMPKTADKTTGPPLSGVLTGALSLFLFEKTRRIENKIRNTKPISKN